MTGLGASMDVRFGATVTEFITYIRELGLNHVELTAEYLHGHPETPDPEKVGELADEHDVSITYHAPYRDWNLGSFNDRSAQAGVEQVKATLDAAAMADAGAVVVHGGSVPKRYPDWVRKKGRENAVESLKQCAQHAVNVGVPLCLENQPPHPKRERHTTTPEALSEILEAIDVGSNGLRVTLDVGHAKVTGTDWRNFVDRFGNRIEVCHLHDNDGTGDQHSPISEYKQIVETINASYNVFEMKSMADIAECVGNTADSRSPTSPPE